MTTTATNHDPSTALRPGEIAVLRTCRPDGASLNGFRWSLEVGAEVAAPDWDPTPRCGGGLHGLPRGVGDGSLLDWDQDARWLVVAVVEADVVDLDGKVKFPRCRVMHVGDRFSAAALIQSLHPGEATVGGTATAGDGGTATAGDGGTATAGDGGTATAGVGGTATAGDGGAVIVLWWNGENYRLVVGVIGEDGIEANVPYRVEGGNLMRAEVQR